jgi:hypothetical protein
MNFLEVIGALAIVGGAFYFLLEYWNKEDKEIRFYRWILDNDSTARYEFTQKYSYLKIGVSDREYSKALREFFTEEKLAEVNQRLEEKEKEGTPK